MIEAEEIFLNIISSYNDKQLVEAIATNLDLSGLFVKNCPDLLELARQWAPMFAGQVNILTPYGIIEYISKKRPDLANVLTSHPDGRRWLRLQINAFKEILFPQKVSRV